MTGEEIAGRIAEVRERIAAAAARAGRDPSEVLLVVVTKEVAADRIREAIDAGATDLGENRAQDLTRKLEELAGLPASWHFIGSLQRNKVNAVTGRVSLIHSVGSEELGRRIGARAAASGGMQDVLVQVNVSGETSKGGVGPDEAPALVDVLRSVPGLGVRGLMTVAPEGDPEQARPFFRTLRDMRDELAGRFEGVNDLSMGMTSDFEVAVEEGATIVRVGTAVFGPHSNALQP